MSDLLNASFVNLKICSKSLFDFTIEGIHPWRTDLGLCGARTEFSFYNVFILQEVPFFDLMVTGEGQSVTLKTILY